MHLSSLLVSDFENWFKQGTCLVAREFEQGPTIGLLQFEESPSWYHINVMARKARFAKRGIATQILNKYFAKYAIAPIPTKLCVREGNLAAQELYKKFGFILIGERQIPQKACPVELDCAMIYNK